MKAVRYQTWSRGALGAALAVALIQSVPVHANGALFFRAAGKNAKVDLVYFGSIRDVEGRRLDYADVTVLVTDVAMTFPFSNDAIGRYRSPDIGVLVKEAGAVVEPRRVEISCFVPGFKPKTMSVPRRTRGTHEVNFVLERDPAQTLDYPLEAPPAPSTAPAVGLMSLLAIAGVVRIASRRRTTVDSGDEAG